MNRFNTKGKRTYNVSEIVVGDIVKFKGTRNKGIRKVLEMYGDVHFNKYADKDIDTRSYFCKVINNCITFKEEPYTSTNSVDKLSHIFRDGTWFKVIKD